MKILSAFFLCLLACILVQAQDSVNRSAGRKSVSGDAGQKSGALIVLDGVPYNGDLKSIDPKEIQDVTIIKQSGATALYGDAGKNGAVIITTKQGIKKIYQGKLGAISKAYHDYLADHQNNDKNFAYILDGVSLGDSPFDWGPKIYGIPPDKIKSVNFKVNTSYNGWNKEATVTITTKK